MAHDFYPEYEMGEPIRWDWKLINVAILLSYVFTTCACLVVIAGLVMAVAELLT